LIDTITTTLTETFTATSTSSETTTTTLEIPTTTTTATPVELLNRAACYYSQLQCPSGYKYCIAEAVGAGSSYDCAGGSSQSNPAQENPGDMWCPDSPQGNIVPVKYTCVLTGYQ
jgi:hypothetical protein